MNSELPTANGASHTLSPEAEEILRRLRAGELLPRADASPSGSPPAPVESPDASGPEAERRSSRLRSALTDRLPVGLRGAVVDPAMRGALGLGVVALLAALVAVGLAWRSAPRPVALPPPAVTTAVTSAPSTMGASAATGTAAGTAAAVPAASASAAGILVDVAGKVRRPGVVSLPAGARVDDALRFAGGVLPGTDTSALSLARKVADGEQILVTGKPGAAPAPASAVAPAAGSSSSGAAAPDASGATGGGPAVPIDLNAATVDQLDALPGVGPVLAGRIIEWRTAHNGFTSVDQLREVKGLGGKTGTELLPLVRVG